MAEFPAPRGWGALARERGSQTLSLFPGAHLRQADGVGLWPFPVPLERDRFLSSSGHQAAVCEFSGHLRLNCVPIERNAITLGDSRAIVNTCSLAFLLDTRLEGLS